MAEKSVGKKPKARKSAAKSRRKTITPRMRLFAHEYLVDLNGAAAAQRAGYSKGHARQTACELLKRPEIQKLIDDLKHERMQRLEMDADQVLQDLLDYRSADLRNIYDENGAVKPIHEWPRFFSQLGVISIKSREEFETVDGEKKLVGFIKEVKWESKTKVLEMIGKHISVGAFRENHKHDITDPVQALYEQLQGTALRPGEPQDDTGGFGVFRPKE